MGELFEKTCRQEIHVLFSLEVLCCVLDTFVLAIFKWRWSGKTKNKIKIPEILSRVKKSQMIVMCLEEK